jgi:hypothetical protein
LFGGNDAVEGTLLKIGDAGALLEHAKGPFFFPAGSILYIRLHGPK